MIHVLNAAPAPINALSIGASGFARNGGLERYYFGLLKALPTADVKVQGLVVGDRQGQCDGSPLVRSYSTSDDSMISRWIKIRRSAPSLMRSTNVVVSHFAPYAFPLLDSIRSRPLVVHFHGPWALESRAEGASRHQVIARSLIERTVYSQATRFITLSRSFADILVARYGVRESKVHVVRGGVELSHFMIESSRREARKRLGWPEDRTILVCVRRLVPSKGVEGLIQAAALLQEQRPKLLVYIVGKGPLAGDLQRQIDERGLGHNVRLVGALSDESLPLAYRAADASVVPSIAYEGFGLVVVESLACGTPVFVTNVGGLPETIGDLSRHLVFAGSDADAIAQGLARFFDGSIRLPSETECSQYAQSFEWAKVAPRIRDIYSEAIAAFS